MFDIGFAELLIIGVVALIVVGPERLPGAVRTGSAWLNRFRRGFQEIKQEVQQELHNDAVMRELKETGDKLRQETEALRKDFSHPFQDSEDRPGPKNSESDLASDGRLKIEDSPPPEISPTSEGSPSGATTGGLPEETDSEVQPK